MVKDEVIDTLKSADNKLKMIDKKFGFIHEHPECGDRIVEMDDYFSAGGDMSLEVLKGAAIDIGGGSGSGTAFAISSVLTALLAYESANEDKATKWFKHVYEEDGELYCDLCNNEIGYEAH